MAQYYDEFKSHDDLPYGDHLSRLMSADARDLLAHSRREERLSQFDLAIHRRPFVTVSELAAYLDCDPRVLVRMIHVGALDAVKVGRTWRIATENARAAFHVERTHAS